MHMHPFYREEDLFPREFTHAKERPWGTLFHNAQNPDSYDSNHALIDRDRVDDLPAALREIRDFYRERGMRPIIYQSILDDGWFGEIAGELAANGYRSWQEEQHWMVLQEDSRITAGGDVRRVTKWSDDLAVHLYEAAGEPWEIAVARRQLENANTLYFAAYVDGKPVGAIYGHVNDEGICRIDYLLVATAHRGQGLGRALTHAFVTHCRENSIPCALWPDGDTPRRIYEEAGFRYVTTLLAGRAVYEG
ncbi:MAG: GNAT family N-acetyltransferase [Clostridia bacterium]|nr:GNAT family N-acetyltransferase [Clostridia bacterium]